MQAELHAYQSQWENIPIRYACECIRFAKNLLASMILSDCDTHSNLLEKRYDIIRRKTISVLQDTE